MGFIGAMLFPHSVLSCVTLNRLNFRERFGLTTMLPVNPVLWDIVEGSYIK